MRVIETTLTNKKDIFNARRAVLSAKDYTGQNFAFLGVVLGVDEEDEGKHITVLKLRDQEQNDIFVSSISETLYESSKDFIDCFEEDLEAGEVLMVRIRVNMSKGGREFLTLESL